EPGDRDRLVNPRDRLGELLLLLRRVGAGRVVDLPEGHFSSSHVRIERVERVMFSRRRGLAGRRPAVPGNGPGGCPGPLPRAGPLELATPMWLTDSGLPGRVIRVTSRAINKHRSSLVSRPSCKKRFTHQSGLERLPSPGAPLSRPGCALATRAWSGQPAAASVTARQGIVNDGRAGAAAPGDPGPAPVLPLEAGVRGPGYPGPLAGASRGSAGAPRGLRRARPLRGTPPVRVPLAAARQPILTLAIRDVRIWPRRTSRLLYGRRGRRPGLASGTAGRLNRS